MTNVQALEDYLAVGTLTTLQLLPRTDTEDRTRSILRGWVTKEYLIVDWPMQHPAFGKARSGQPCVVRFVFEGHAVGFSSTIVDLDRNSKQPMLIIDWPEDARMVALRQSERIALHLACRYTVGGANNEADAEILDISEGGCSVNVDTAPKVGATLNLTFQLPDGYPAEGTEAVVRSVVRYGDGYKAGCQFTGLDANTKHAIVLYLASTVESQRQARRHGQAVVLFEPDFEVVQYAQDTLSEAGYHVAAAPGLMQLFHRLYSTTPKTLVYNLDAAEVGFKEVLDIVRSSDVLQELQIYAYGDNTADAKARGVHTDQLHGILDMLRKQAVESAPAGQTG